MNIVLTADSRKNELLANFCIAYRQILSNHNLVSTLNTGRYVEQAAGLKIKAMPTEIKSSIEQLASRAMYNEIDAVIYLRDHGSSSANTDALLRACDVNSIPFATNIATAEILVLAIDRGDLDWRTLVR